MRGLQVALDAVARLREATGGEQPDLGAVAMLAELATADGVRIGVNEALKPVRETDVLALRRAARGLELRMAPSPSLLKVALEARPDRVLLCAAPDASGSDGQPLTPETLRGDLAPLVRALHEAGIRVWARVAAPLDAVKAAHAANLAGVELYTGSVVDLPPREREQALERVGDAARLAAKLRLGLSVGGGLDLASLEPVLEAAPAVDWVTVGRGFVTRALLLGIDRAVHDLRARLR